MSHHPDFLNNKKQFYKLNDTVHVLNEVIPLDFGDYKEIENFIELLHDEANTFLNEEFGITINKTSEYIKSWYDEESTYISYTFYNGELCYFSTYNGERHGYFQLVFNDRNIHINTVSKSPEANCALMRILYNVLEKYPN